MPRNPGTRIGRPPKISLPKPTKLASGERQGAGPTDGYDSAIPGSAYTRTQRMPQWHEDPKMCRGGMTPRGRR